MLISGNHSQLLNVPKRVQRLFNKIEVNWRDNLLLGEMSVKSWDVNLKMHKTNHNKGLLYYFNPQAPNVLTCHKSLRISLNIDAIASIIVTNINRSAVGPCMRQHLRFMVKQ